MSDEKLENLHIPLWLIKDTCWMLTLKIMGVIMIFPTLIVSFMIAWRSRKTHKLLMNLAITNWIMANAYWMCTEFFHYDEYKKLALIPFLIGIGFVFMFYKNTFKK